MNSFLGVPGDSTLQRDCSEQTAREHRRRGQEDLGRRLRGVETSIAAASIATRPGGERTSATGDAGCPDV